MPTYHQVNLDYAPRVNGTGLFVKAKGTFAAADLHKDGQADDSDRQLAFERLLCRLSRELGADVIPVFIAWRNGRLRMDKGCIGHSVARNFLERPTDNEAGYVTHVRIVGDCSNA